MQGTVIDTLEKLRTEGYSLTAYCNTSAECHHSDVLDLDALIKALGPDFDFVDRRAELLSRLKCDKCGRKGIEIRVLPGFRPPSYSPSTVW